MRFALRLPFLFAIASGAFAMVACAAETDTASQEPAASDGTAGDEQDIKALVIGEASNGKTVSIQLGQSFKIGLSESIYPAKWKVTSVDKTLGAPKESVLRAQGNLGIGAPSTHLFTWSTKSPLDLVGKHKINFAYAPTAPSSPATKTFSVTIDIKAASGAFCAGIAGIACPAGQFCDLSGGAQCGLADQSGKCQPKPEVCPMYISPVCGCDGKSYNNSCDANIAGVSVKAGGPCASTP
jgi:hypothetical protein